MVFISLSLVDNETEWTSFLRNIQYKDYIYTREKALKVNFALDYEIKSIPHYLMIDENGKIAAYAVERLDSDEVLTFLKHK